MTAAGLALPLVDGLSSPEISLIVLALGLGSGALSHVNDAGFWMIKEFFGLTVGQTFKSWTMMTVLAPIVGMAIVSVLWLVI